MGQWPRTGLPEGGAAGVAETVVILR
jgi:hypothetical protein